MWKRREDYRDDQSLNLCATKMDTVTEQKHRKKQLDKIQYTTQTVLY